MFKNYLIIYMLILSFSSFAHPDGIYILNGQDKATVTFKSLKRCPKIKGAMRGGLRSLIFSDQAKKNPYLFISGNYVEVHPDDGEEYIMTDSRCIPDSRKVMVPATRNTFGDFSLKRKQR